jgi:hypothetical protein
LLILLNELIFNVIPVDLYVFFNQSTATSFVTGSLGSIVTPAAITDG